MLRFDLHIHTIASGHAFNTLFEIAHYASKNKMEVIGITDHGPDMKGAPSLGYFEMVKIIPSKIENVAIIGGCESNIVNLNGNIDLPINVQKDMNLVMAGLHSRTSYPVNSNVTDNTTAIINAIQKNRIHILSHPCRPEFPIDIKEVYNVANYYGTLLEINLSSLNHIDKSTFDKSLDEFRLIIETAKLNKSKIVISSDAHIATMVGDDSVLERLQLDIHPDMILGNQGGYEEIKEFLESK